MSDSEDEVVGTRRFTKSSKLLISDDEDSEVGNTTSQSITTIGNQNKANSRSQSPNVNSDASNSDSGKSSNSSVKSAPSLKSSQSICSTNSEKIRSSISPTSRRSSSNFSRRSQSRSSSSSSSSESEVNDRTIVGSQETPCSQNSSKSSKSKSPNSQSSRSSLLSSRSQKSYQSTPSQAPEIARKSSDDDSSASDEGFGVLKRLRLVKKVHSDEDGSDIDISIANESDENVAVTKKSSDENGSDIDISIANDMTTTFSEESHTKRKKKYILVLDSDSDDSNDGNDITLRVSEDEESAENKTKESDHDELGTSNLTAKEKRKMRLGKLNEKKKLEFAKLAEKKTKKNKKDKALETSKTDETTDQQQENKVEPVCKKFLLLSDDDFSDDDAVLKRSPISDGNESKKKKKPETDNFDSEDSTCLEKRKQPRSRAPKSGDSSKKELQESKRKLKKQQEAMLEIKSTTQKMIRNGRIALPYHQPKQRSLDEFLQRRNNLPSIPLRSSYDILGLAREHLSKKEEEIAQFYKSESEHSEEEQTIDETSINQTEGATQLAENLASDSLMNRDDLNEDDFSIACDERDIVSCPNESENESTPIPNKNPEVTTHPEPVQIDEIADTNICNNAQDEKVPSDDEKSSTTELATESIPTAVISEENNLEKVSKSNSSSDFDLNLTPDVHDDIQEDKESAHEVVDSSSNNCSETVVENDSKDVDTNSVTVDNALEHDTDTFQLQIEDSCPVKANTTPSDSQSNDPSATDLSKPTISETLRNKKLALLSSLKKNLSDVKLKRDEHSVLQFEVESAPKSDIDKFIEKFASHVTAKNKGKHQPTKTSVTNVQTDAQGEIIDIVKETLTLKQSHNEEDDVKEKFLLPGCKHSFFKDQMLKTLVSKKTANWKKFQEEKYSLYDTNDYDNEDIEDEEDVEEIGGRKLHFEPYHPEDEPEDEDLIEDDIDLTEKRDKKKNEYVDEEAEVDYDEDENVMGASDEEGDSNDENFEDAVDLDEEEKKNLEKSFEKENSSNEDDKFEDAENLDYEKENKENDEEVDSDEELLNNFYKSFDKPKTDKSHPPTNLFENNVTGLDLENKVLGLENTCTQSNDPFVDFSNTQIFSICSGKFATQVERTASNATSQFSGDSQFPDESQDFNLSMQETNDGFCKPSDKSLSSVNNSSFLLSDESDTEELFNRKKKTIRLQDSDDEESETPKSQNENEADENDELDDGGDENGEEQDLQSEDDLDGDIEYNSEEEMVDFKKPAPTDFFENEAELSESEWGSEDENEKDLDQLEREAGDDDEIDTDKLKEELGRIHMRQMLDDDQKDVRLLQEILLEDGELHSDGQRSRKFQWKNLDGEGFFANPFGDSDDEKVLLDDDIDGDDQAENWRRMRHEREMFLLKQEKNTELLLSAEDESSSNLLQISSTTKVTLKSTVTEELTKIVPAKSPGNKFPLGATKMKCGSFLNRGQLILSRIAGTVSETSKENIRGAKNGRNFVFAAISPEKELPEVPLDNKTEKRKISSKSVMAAKKLKLNDKTGNENAPMRSGLLAQLALSDS